MFAPSNCSFGKTVERPPPHIVHSLYGRKSFNGHYISSFELASHSGSLGFACLRTLTVLSGPRNEWKAMSKSSFCWQVGITSCDIVDRYIYIYSCQKLPRFIRPTGRLRRHSRCLRSPAQYWTPASSLRAATLQYPPVQGIPPFSHHLDQACFHSHLHRHRHCCQAG